MRKMIDVIQEHGIPSEADILLAQCCDMLIERVNQPRQENKAAPHLKLIEQRGRYPPQILHINSGKMSEKP